MNNNTYSELDTICNKVNELDSKISNSELRLIGLPDKKTKEQKLME